MKITNILAALLLACSACAAYAQEDGTPVGEVELGALIEEVGLGALIEAAETGDSDIQYVLGTMYQFGLGVPQDYGKAAQWFRKAAEQGLAGAQNNLGIKYDNGQGVPQDYGKAAQWY
ncbi:MAG: tetratricopeptide repeat protein, partial [Parvularculaceae bacterium]